MAIANTIETFLSKHQVTYDLLAHKKTYSSHDSAQAAHIMDDHVAKAVVVKDSQGFAMVVIPASDWVKLGALRKESNRDFRLASESEVDNIFADCEPGAIPPLGPAYKMETFLDDRLSSLANVYFEAGDHKHFIHINADGFKELFKGVRHGHFSRYYN